MRRIVAAVLVLAFLPASLAFAEIVQRGNVRVSFQAEIAPTKLPRERSAPIAVSISAEVSPVKGKVPPQLRRIVIEINRAGRIDGTGLPVCELRDIQPSTSAKALAACRGSLVGSGRFSARVLFPEQAPFPSDGKVLAFHGRYEGKPAILAHVYGTDPAPTSVTLPFTIARGGGRLATKLIGSLPAVTTDWGYVTGLQLTLRRSYRYAGRARSYASASCPAPRGYGRVSFPLARASFELGKRTLRQTLVRTCSAR